MKRILVAMIIIISILASGTVVARNARSSEACGLERWDVKTLTDPAARQINFAPKVATVEDLVAMPVPAALRSRGQVPRQDPEKQLYTVNAWLIGYKQENDSDFHVVIAGKTGATMIIEFPDPGCVGAFRKAEMAQARADFVRYYGKPGPRFTRLRPGIPVPVTATGVLFFDFLHGQTGVAKNAVELHPVIGLQQPGLRPK